MSQPKHTPGPWRYVKANPSPTTGGHMISGAKPGYLAEVRDCGSGDVEANARRIVQCVNAHDGLVEALHIIASTTTDRAAREEAQRALCASSQSLGASLVLLRQDDRIVAGSCDVDQPVPVPAAGAQEIAPVFVKLGIDGPEEHRQVAEPAGPHGGDATGRRADSMTRPIQFHGRGEPTRQGLTSEAAEGTPASSEPDERKPASPELRLSAPQDGGQG